MTFNVLKYSVAISIFSLLVGCGPYSFTGISLSTNTKTFQVNYFQNTAALIEPGIDRDFTLALQDLILNQTNLGLVNSNGDIVYEGEIVEYAITPMSATAQNTAAQNRLTITINVRYFNVKNEEDNYEKRFSFFYDFPAEQQLYDIKDTAHNDIFDRITQDIFNASLAKW